MSGSSILHNIQLSKSVSQNVLFGSFIIETDANLLHCTPSLSCKNEITYDPSYGLIHQEFNEHLVLKLSYILQGCILISPIKDIR